MRLYFRTYPFEITVCFVATITEQLNTIQKLIYSFLCFVLYQNAQWSLKSVVLFILFVEVNAYNISISVVKYSVYYLNLFLKCDSINNFVNQ